MAPLPYRVSVSMLDEECAYDWMFIYDSPPHASEIKRLIEGRYRWKACAAWLYVDRYREVAQDVPCNHDLSLDEVTTFLRLFERVTGAVAEHFGIRYWGDFEYGEHPIFLPNADPAVVAEFVRLDWPDAPPERVEQIVDAIFKKAARVAH